MTSKSYNYLLNTENYAPVYELVDLLTRTVQDNQDIIGRLTKTIDLHLAYPNIPETDPSPDEGDTKNANDDQKRPTNGNLDPPPEAEHDLLRGFLDTSLGLDRISYDKRAFEGIQNARIRQLLVDNYRLLRLRQMKAKENREYLGIYKKYEQMLTQVVIPKWTEDVSKQNLRNVAHLRKLCVEEKRPAEDKVWAAYTEYYEVLEQMQRFTGILVEISTRHLQAADVERLGMQLQIVGQLREHIKRIMGEEVIGA